MIYLLYYRHKTMCMEKQHNTILIVKKIAKIVSSRDLVHNLEKEVSRQEHSIVSLDFTDVEFISRSAAHELLLLQEKMRTKTFKKKEVLFVHTSDDVKKMLRIVASNKAVPESSKPRIRLEKIDIDTLMRAASSG